MELRIHGVNNTPAPAMLALPDHAVEQFRGDRFGSFWRPRQDRLADLPVNDPGRPRADVEREAYSWGGMARSTPGAPGSGVASVVANVAGRIGWALLLPFGLANVAYWSREIPRTWTEDDELTHAEKLKKAELLAADAHERGTREDGTEPRDTPVAGADPGKSRWWNAGRGAASTRLFGLGLTILLVLSVSVAVVDLYAIQCSFPDTTCRQLPSWLDVLGDPAQHVRVLAASAVPVLLLVGLLLLTSLSRSRYESTTTEDRQPFRSGVLLSRRSMWRGSPRLRRLTRLHLAAGFCVVTLVTGPELFRHAAVFPFTVVLAGFLLVLVAFRVMRTAADCPDAPKTEKSGVWSWALVVATGVVLAVHGFAIYYTEPVFTGSLWLVRWGPPAVTACLLGIALSGWSWRKREKRVPWLASLVFAAGLIATAEWPWAGLVVVAAGALLIGYAVRGNREWEAWGGTGPGVLLGLSLVSSLLLMTVLVLTLRSWLGGAEPLQKLPQAPWFYWWTSGSFTAALAVLAGLVVVLVVVLGLRVRRPADFEKDTSLAIPAGQEALVMRWRHVIASAHRAEVVVGVLSALSTAAVALAVHVTFARPSWVDWRVPAWVFEQGVTYTGLAGVALVGSFVGAGVLANRRPLGLLWDLMCFLPRTAHPFAPPCYAERAVPEIAERVRDWLDRHPEDPEKPENSPVVVLSAHSLGAVLAVAAIYQLPRKHLARVKLLTCGVQLRPYFGRIFPELLGPGVLGTVRSRRGTIWALDPWHRQDDPGPQPEPVVAPADTLKGVLEGRWVNLWRRTDYLGFPVIGYGKPDGTSIDQWANETNGSPDKVETHSDYHRCAAYTAAFTRLVPEPPPAQPS
ncbi:hypothetical protein BBK82_46560 [Lentzea guizhouensis]|uniref:Uncharacterized protein n=1 Tax=Lentzea guizhouensis TaxID=1586287 RepID=A0A1B2HX48_9PSEU|nr:hypothetical protein BBK82_46560 [Lentzea guizhouensis]